MPVQSLYFCIVSVGESQISFYWSVSKFEIDIDNRCSIYVRNTNTFIRNHSLYRNYDTSFQIMSLEMHVLLMHIVIFGEYSHPVMLKHTPLDR